MVVNNAGTLLVVSPGSLPGGAVTMNNTSLLAGNGTIGGNVTVTGAANIAPGNNGVGTLPISGNLTVSAMAGGAGTLRYQLGPIANSDRITVGGTLAIGTNVLGFNDFVFTNVGGLEDGTYKLITTTGGITGTLQEANLSGSIGEATGTLQISDGGTGTDIELVVTGAPVGSPYGIWSGGAPPNGDANHDSVQNGVAWALGAASPNENAIGRLPTIDNTSDPDFVLFRFNRSDAANDDPKTTITVEYATNLAAWTPVGADTDDVKTEVTPGSPTDTVVVKLRRSTLAPDGKLFARLKVMVTE